jgi:predicted small integral membrane protein
MKRQAAKTTTSISDSTAVREKEETEMVKKSSISKEELMRAKRAVSFYGMRAANDMTDLFRTAVKISPAVAMVTMLASEVYADPKSAAEEAIKGVLSVLYLITNVIGILFVLIGLVRLVIAHSQEDAPGQQKAAMFIGTGIALILLQFAFSSIKPENWLIDSAGGGKGKT